MLAKFAIATTPAELCAVLMEREGKDLLANADIIGKGMAAARIERAGKKQSGLNIALAALKDEGLADAKNSDDLLAAVRTLRILGFGLACVDEHRADAVAELRTAVVARVEELADGKLGSGS